MTVREEIMNGLADLEPLRLEIDKDTQDHGRPTTEYTLYFNTPNGIVQASLAFADDLKVGAEQVVRVFRSYLVKDLEALR